jgi:hypothetical protein
MRCIGTQHRRVGAIAISVQICSGIKGLGFVVCMVSDVRLKGPQIDLPGATEQQHRSIPNSLARLTPSSILENGGVFTLVPVKSMPPDNGATVNGSLQPSKITVLCRHPVLVPLIASQKLVYPNAIRHAGIQEQDSKRTNRCDHVYGRSWPTPAGVWHRKAGTWQARFKLSGPSKRSSHPLAPSLRVLCALHPGIIPLANCIDHVRMMAWALTQAPGERLQCLTQAERHCEFT